ncbi:MAG: hypothetical protein E4H00_06565 [Myxococcales bacterium]|jgi:hypothetical protein|nr:MAG: hypothetical protein E4H00_06565 [Myxococcales bacterium]
MGTRAWLAVLLALAIGCEGVIGSGDGVGLERTLDAGTIPGPTPDASIAVDASVPDAGSPMDAGTGGTPGPCANGPLAAPISNCSPERLPTTGDPHEDCFERINQFRWECQCLPPLARWVDGEVCTDGNAEYDSINGVHASFSALPCGSGGRAQNECPGWPSNDQVITGCLRSMWDEGPEDGNPDTVNGHYESMASTTYTQVACGFFTTPSGDVWGVQNFD